MNLLNVLQHKETQHTPPLWLMRQAGRYLPEYKAVRKQFPDFMAFCFTPEAVCEVTLQPIQRFDFDAAIIFSDILVIPHALGQKVWFEENYGPRLANCSLEQLCAQAPFIDLAAELKQVAVGIEKTRTKLPAHKPLLGFAGAPWTLSTYMISQGKTADFSTIVNFAHRFEDLFLNLLDVLTQKVVALLKLHIDAGVNALQIFESWASAVPKALQQKYLFDPLQKIVHELQAYAPHIPIIYYGRGISNAYTKLDHLNIAFGVDENGDMGTLCADLPQHVLQGNLSPQTLLSGHQLDAQIDFILSACQNRPFIFNLGHGIHKDTPLAHVERIVTRVRK